jgi:hypothetical protein
MRSTPDTSHASLITKPATRIHNAIRLQEKPIPNGNSECVLAEERMEFCHG